jgi:glyoxylase-like metal-dependent hydrolase (beta-lactamase superfamily II)
MGTANAWLVLGDPLTLIDVGPRTDAGLSMVEAELRSHGLRVEDLELLIATHHHLDHVGLMATLAARSGAEVAALGGVADFGADCYQRIAEARGLAERVMRANGVPDQAVADSAELWDYVAEYTEPFTVTQRLEDGDLITAGSHTYRAIHRPGHSATDTLFVDAARRRAFVGDHLLAHISVNFEMRPPDGSDAHPTRERGAPLVGYLQALRLTRGLGMTALMTGHGRVIHDPDEVIGQRLAFHAGRRDAIEALLRDRSPQTAFELACSIWGEATAREQAVLVISEVLGHSDLLLEADAVLERQSEDGTRSFSWRPPGKRHPSA